MRNREEEWVVMEGGDCPNLSQPVCLCRHMGGTSGGVGCSLSGWQAGKP